MNFEVKITHPNVKVFHSSCHFFISDWINGHNLAILAPIHFYLTAFYLSHVSNSDGTHIKIL